MCESLPIQVVAGLGNPGKAYASTRHNVGFLLADDWLEHRGCKWKRSFRFRGECSKTSWQGREVHVIKPHTFMNASGTSLRSVLQYFKLEPQQLMCIYDDITLPVGRLKLSIGGGDGGHNGIRDIQRLLGNEFTRFRVGVGGKPSPEMDLKDWVLSSLDLQEIKTLRSNFEFYRNSIELVLRTGAVLAMNTINQKPEIT